MSRTESYRRTTREDIIAHGEAVIARLKEQEGYAELQENAKALGVGISVYMRDTFTYDRRHEYTLSLDEEEIPYGYQADLRIDLTRDGKILFVCDEAGAYDQMSISFPIITTPETFFGRKMKFVDFEEIDGADSVIDYIADFLDAIGEGKGGVVSVLSANEKEIAFPKEKEMITSLAELPEGDVIELLPGHFEGVYLGERSVFFTPEAFLPFTVLLEAAEFGFHISHGVSVLDEEKWSQFSQSVRSFCQQLRKNNCGFSDILSQMKLYSLEPSDTEEKHLNALCYENKEQFIRICDALLDWGDEVMDENAEKKISILWI